ncbi:RING/U-box superfamily protein [Artemisia annua]|uniref:RING/U-box superfamily protein n=1 Tax=Artemisia annua TaxID=35608 RepID=A0A2U1MJD5_ARTAN|nr:RING/U-box superfamily protein [Artemisia annua]
MDCDSVSNGVILNSKDVNKKKRVNRSAKLKQMKNKGSKEENKGGVGAKVAVSDMHEGNEAGIVRNTSSSSSSSSSSGGCGCFYSDMTEEDAGDDGCLDDWEAIADALAAEDVKNDCENKTGENENENGREMNFEYETERVKEGVEDREKVNCRAWRPDDAYRPQDLDLTDSSFLPCPCGYRLCLFCYKRILEDNGRYPDTMVNFTCFEISETVYFKYELRKPKNECTKYVLVYGSYKAGVVAGNALCSIISSILLVNLITDACSQFSFYHLMQDRYDYLTKYHPACLNMTTDQAKQLDNFTCNDCLSLDGQPQIVVHVLNRIGSCGYLLIPRHDHRIHGLSNLQSPIPNQSIAGSRHTGRLWVQKLSSCGKKARLEHAHTRSTGATSFARRTQEWKLSSCGKKARLEHAHTRSTGATSFARRTQEWVKANDEILRKKKEIGGSEGDVEHAVVAEIAREVLNKLIGDEEPHCFGAGVTKSQVSKFSCDLRKMRGEVLTNENRFLLEKVETQKKTIRDSKKQVETQGLQLKNMGESLSELHGMLKVFQTAFPDLYNVASTAAATRTCDKHPSSSVSPVLDHYSPVMDHYPPATDHYPDSIAKIVDSIADLYLQICIQLQKL